MSHNLDDWREDLAAYNDMLDTRQQAYNERVPKADAVMAATDLDALTQRRVDFESRINEIEKSNDVAALGTPEEQKTWARLKRIEDYLALHPDDPDLTEMREKLRLMKGVMYWRLSESFKARLWNERRSVKELEASLIETQRRALLVKQARAGVPSDTGDFAARVAAVRDAHGSAQAASGRADREAEPLSAVDRHRRAGAAEAAHRDLSDPGALRIGRDLRQGHEREAEGASMSRSSASIAFFAAALTALGCWALAPAAAAASNKPATIKDLEGQQVDVSTDPPQGVDTNKTMDSYKRFLDLNAGDAALREEAMRRLADLNLESSESERIARELATNEGLRATEAIHLYSALLKAYPKYERNDSVLYQLARAYELNAQQDKALASLDRLVANYPNSRYIDEAQFRRGELLFSMKAYPAAQAAYEAVIKMGASVGVSIIKASTSTAGPCSSRARTIAASSPSRASSIRCWCPKRTRIN